MRGSFVKQCLTGQYASLADAGTADIAMNIPIVAPGAMPNFRGVAQGIQLWAIECEFSDGTWFTTDDKTLTFILADQTVTAELYVNNRNVYFKEKLHSELTTSGAILHTQIVKQEFYPAIPFYGAQIHVGIVNASGVAQSVYVKIWYSFVTLTRDDLIGQLQNQLT